ncbi:zinc metalloprotease HtpX [Patescibacteria group bacterium]
MYKQIDANIRKTFILITFFLIFIVGLGWVFSFIFNNPLILYIAVVISLFQAWISYFYSDKIALAVSGAREVKRAEALELYRIVENLTITAGLPKPKICIITDSSLNAFATGRDPKHSTIAVTTGLLEKLSKSELQGVIAHEMSHIKNYDIRVMTVVVVLVGSIALVSDFFIRSLWWGRGGRNREGGQLGVILMIVGIVLAILAPLIAQLIQLAISRKREYLADASGALLTRYPEGLASALEKIQYNSKPMKRANRATAHLFISNPFSTKKISGLFATHPPIEDRIKQLRAMIGKS